ncbi:MAG: hypothetical protein KKE77_09550 [Alphaproteobacteria bacterium]|nr:hypothetical protein [Alphaproteobacteria bacterium]
MPFTADEVTHLPAVISGPRFATYLQARGGHVEDALALYVWNAEVSAAFMVPIHLCEVAIRNAAAEAIEAVHGPTWPWVNGFVRSLPRPRRPFDYDPQTNLRQVAGRQPTVGKVVSEVNFAFWEKVFTTGQDERMWNPHFRTVLPGAPGALSVAQARSKVFSDLVTIRKFRNRIAHHEPIFARTLRDDYAVMRELIEWRRPDAAAWLDKVERISALLAARP